MSLTSSLANFHSYKASFVVQTCDNGARSVLYKGMGEIQISNSNSHLIYILCSFQVPYV